MKDYTGQKLFGSWPYKLWKQCYLGDESVLSEKIFLVLCPEYPKYSPKQNKEEQEATEVGPRHSDSELEW